jgi:hypothetical protein
VTETVVERSGKRTESGDEGGHGVRVTGDAVPAEAGDELGGGRYLLAVVEQTEASSSRVTAPSRLASR